MYTVSFGEPESGATYTVTSWRELIEVMTHAARHLADGEVPAGHLACPANLHPFRWAQVPGLVLDPTRLDAVSGRRNWNALEQCAAQIYALAGLYPNGQPRQPLALVQPRSEV